MSQSLELNQRHHVMHLLPEVGCGPKAWTVLKELHAPTSVVATLMLERELSALRLSEGEPVQPVLDKMRDLYAKLATAGITYPEQTKCLKMLSLLPESWVQLTSGLSLPQNQSLWTLEWVRTKILEEDFRRRQLSGGDDGSSGYGMQGSKRGRGRGFGGAGRGAKKYDDSNDQQGGTGWGRGAKSGRGGKSGAGGKMKGSCSYCEKEGHPWFLCYKKPDGWTPQNCHQDGGARRNQKNGANMVADAAWTMTPHKEMLDDVRAAPINEVCSASGHALNVAGAGRAAFKGADGKLVVLHDVLFVPDLKANLISLRKLAKAGLSTSTDGAAGKTGALGSAQIQGCVQIHVAAAGVGVARGWCEGVGQIWGDGLDNGTPTLGAGGNAFVEAARERWRRQGSKKPLELVHMDLGIQRELTTAYSPQSNGVAERANRTILETARALLIESGVGNSMWPNAVRHATVARNRVLTKVGNESWVPLERWFGRKPPVDMLRVFGCMAVAHVPKKYRSKLGARAIWCEHLGLAAESKGWLLWEPSKGVLFDSRDVKFVEGMMYRGWKIQPETKVSEQMEQIAMHLDLTPSVWKEGEEAAAEDGDGEKVQETPGGGGDDVETSDSTKEAAGSEGGEQQLGKAKIHALPSRRKSKGVVMRGRETPVSRPGCTRMATLKLIAGADVAEQQLGNEEALLILPLGYDPDEEDEPAYCFLAPAPEERGSMEEALAGPDREKWLVSRDAEYQSLLENGTWDLVVLPEGKEAVQCKWVLRIKTDDKRQVTIYKSRLVAKGLMQKEKQDFNEIFAPTAKPPTLRVLLADAAVSGKSIIQMDISTAFLNGILEEDVYMTQPPGYDDGTGRVCKLKKTSSCDESLFLKGEGEKLVLLLVYVDDILLFSSSMKEIQNVQQQLMKNFKCKTLGEVKYYLGMHMERDLDHRWLKLHQEKFIKELGEKYGIENEHKVDAAERVVKYLNSHPSIGVQYSASAQVKQKGIEVLKEKGERLGEGKLFLTCFTNATWASEKDDSSSVGGYICVVGGGPVCWRSKKQTKTALSSVESEYMAMFHGVKEVIWLR
ncbi:unnamed protein product, partial [Closterium sp. NIES-54]